MIDKKYKIIIDNLLELKDKTHLELKSRFNVEDIAKSVIAFLNTNGGCLILGIDDDKNIVGIDNPESEKEKIYKHLQAHIKPVAPVTLDVINYEEKDIILIHVWMGAQKPYRYTVIEGAFEGVGEGVTEGVKEKRKQILAVILQNPGIRVPGIENRTQIPVKTIERYIKQLRTANLIEFRGNSPQTGGYYSMIKN